MTLALLKNTFFTHTSPPVIIACSKMENTLILGMSASPCSWAELCLPWPAWMVLCASLDIVSGCPGDVYLYDLVRNGLHSQLHSHCVPFLLLNHKSNPWKEEEETVRWFKHPRSHQNCPCRGGIGWWALSVFTSMIVMSADSAFPLADGSCQSSSGCLLNIHTPYLAYYWN